MCRAFLSIAKAYKFRKSKNKSKKSNKKLAGMKNSCKFASSNNNN